MSKYFSFRLGAVVLALWAMQLPVSARKKPQVPDSLRTIRVEVNGVELTMQRVEGGSFVMGATQDQYDRDIYTNKPAHLVFLSPFYIAETEVTNRLWHAVMPEKEMLGPKGYPTHPVSFVTWNDAQEFVRRLDSITGYAFRLPTEAEWEYAARGGAKSKGYRFAGANEADSVGWTYVVAGQWTHPVGRKRPNELGLYDMSGNSWEWVYDWLIGYTEEAKTNPVQLTGSGNKTRRGGSYDEPEDFARVSRRAIRSRDGAAGMGLRLGLSTTVLDGMKEPCVAANPQATKCDGSEYRDCRLITGEDEAWVGESATLLLQEDGAAAISGYPVVSGEWYTLNNRSLNIVSSKGVTTTYAYYVFSEDEITMINDAGMPYRLYKKAKSESKSLPTIPTITNPTALEKLIEAVEPERFVTAEQLAHPDTTVRDPRIMADDGYTWFMDGRCCGGNHKYRFHLSPNGDAEFVVMDYDDTYKENILAKGRWFTVGNIALHIMLNGKYYNYLYTSGTRTFSNSEYLPEGPIFCHISFQSYERGDFRIFSRTKYDDKVKRPRGFNGENPIHDPVEYQPYSE